MSEERRRGRVLALAAALGLVVVLLYLRTAGFGFLTFDDVPFLLDNPFVRGGLSWRGVAWAFSSDPMLFNPLAWVSHMLDFELFGGSPAGPHLVNVALHAGTAVLLFLFLARATGAAGASFAVALLFAVHPQRVESVAWVIERKDVLSGLLAMATLLAWGRWVRTSRREMRAVAALLFLLALLAKPMVVTLPILLLVIEGWPLGRLRAAGGTTSFRDAVLEKVPLLALSAVSAVLTLVAQAGAGAVSDLEGVSLLRRVSLVAGSVVWHVEKLAWPRGLAITYPLRPTAPLGEVVARATLVLLATGAAVALRRRYPFVLTGWLWYLVVIAPVSGVLQAGAQETTDHFSYLPSIGLVLIAVFGVRELLLRLTPALALRLGTLVTASVAAVFAVHTWVYLGTFRNAATVFEHALSEDPESWLAANNLAGIAIAGGQPERGLELYRQGLSAAPGSAWITGNLVNALARMGRRDEALAALDEALRQQPGSAVVARLAATWSTRLDDARGQRRALARLVVLDPSDAAARRALRLLGRRP